MSSPHPQVLPKMNTILVFTVSTDVHFRHICQILRDRGSKVLPIFVDDGHWLSRYKISFQDQFLIFEDVRVEGGMTIWYRKPELKGIENEPAVSSYVENENMALIEGFEFFTQHCRWIHSPQKLRKTSNKLFQLLCAKQQGLVIPETLVTNVLPEAKKFFETYNGRLVGKALGPQVVFKDEKTAFGLRTVVLKEEHLTDGLLVAPIIIQKQIEILHEVRVVLIGQNIFAFGIKPRNGNTRSDIKLYKLDELDHFHYELSKEVRAIFWLLLKILV